MKVRCGPTGEERADAARIALPAFRETWHKRFAIFPVRVGPGDCRWLEWYESRFPYAYVSYGRIHTGDTVIRRPKEESPGG